MEDRVPFNFVPVRKVDLHQSFQEALDIYHQQDQAQMECIPEIPKENNVTYLIAKVLLCVEEWMEGNDASHDYQHVDRVTKLAASMIRREGVYNDQMQRLILLTAALHEVGDRKYSKDDADVRSQRQRARDKLVELKVHPYEADTVIHLLDYISFSSEKTQRDLSMLDLKLQRVVDIVRDADRLEALGAIGIARCFIYGGAHGSVLHDPEIEPHMNMTAEEYKQHKNCTMMNHFPEKLFKLADIMSTDIGREIARERHDFMRQFYDRFMQEWEGVV